MNRRVIVPINRSTAESQCTWLRFLFGHIGMKSSTGELCVVIMEIMGRHRHAGLLEFADQRRFLQNIVESKTNDVGDAGLPKRVFSLAFEKHGSLYASAVGHIRIDVLRRAIEFTDDDSLVGQLPKKIDPVAFAIDDKRDLDHGRHETFLDHGSPGKRFSSVVAIRIRVEKQFCDCRMSTGILLAFLKHVVGRDPMRERGIENAESASKIQCG